MICDAHIHYIPKELSNYTSFYRGVWSDESGLFSYLEENSIDKALLVYPSTDAWLKVSQSQVCQIYNQALEEMVRKNPKIVAAGLVDLDNLSHISSQINHLAEKGFKAVSIASSYQGRFLVKELGSLFQAAQAAELAVFVHPQTINPIGYERVKDPLLMPVLEYSFDTAMFLGLLMVEEVLSNSKVNFIFSSLAGVVPFLKDRFDRIYKMLRKRGLVKDLGSEPSALLSRVYVDTSGASLDYIKMALNLFGPEHILWGSDYPVCGDLAESFEDLKKLCPETEEKIKSKNFLELFNLR